MYRNMNFRRFARIAAIVFAIVALAQLFLVLSGWVITVNGEAVPLWLIWLACVAAAALACVGLTLGIGEEVETEGDRGWHRGWLVCGVSVATGLVEVLFISASQEDARLGASNAARNRVSEYTHFTIISPDNKSERARDEYHHPGFDRQPATGLPSRPD
jgi:NADH:ubiquinone oxidoreductase subunit 6 (subunit J)